MLLPWPLPEKQAMVTMPPLGMTLTDHSYYQTRTNMLQWSETVCCCLDSLKLSEQSETVLTI